MPEHAEPGWAPRVGRAAHAFGRHLARHAGSDERAPRDDDEFAVRRARDGGRQILVARGRLDLATAWLGAGAAAREATDAGEVVVDLGGVELIDSAGMEVVIHATARSRRHGKQLVILSGPAHVHRRFEVSGLVARLPFVVRRVGIPLP